MGPPATPQGTARMQAATIAFGMAGLVILVARPPLEATGHLHPPR